MSIGRFFRLDKDANPSNDLLLFRYQRFDYIPDSNQFSIYVVLQYDSIEFYYTSKKDFNHTRLFKIGLNDSINPQGSIIQQLNHLRKLNRHKISLEETDQEEKAQRPNKQKGDLQKSGFPNYSDLEIWNEVGKNQMGHLYIKNKKVIFFCFSTLFLDFLFDLQHSHIFRESRYFKRVRFIIQKNPLFAAIVTKCKFYHARERFQPKFKNQILYDDFVETRENWLAMLVEVRNIETFRKSAWFENNLEKEVDNVVFEKKVSPNVLYEQSMNEKITDFYLSRLNYLQGSCFNIKNHPLNFIVSILALLAGSFILIKPKISSIILLITSCYFICVWIYEEFIRKKSTPGYLYKNSRIGITSLYMPKLQITLFITWLGYSSAIESIPDWDFIYNGILFFISLPLIFLYLQKEIQNLTPNLSSGSLFRRSSFMLLFSYLSSGITGSILLTFAIRSADEDALAKFEWFPYYQYEIALSAWFGATIFVVFFGLFINFLFKGEKFTGF